jgi:hypothetical protein
VAGQVVPDQDQAKWWQWQVGDMPQPGGPLGCQRAFDFLVPVERGSNIPLRQQLYRLLREAILDGRLPVAARLPSTRLVAQQTGVARQTVASDCCPGRGSS